MTPSESTTATFLVELARALHVYGTPSYELEAAMDECAARLGIEVKFFSMPTAIFASFGPAGECRTTLVRVEPGDIDLSKLVDVCEVQARVVSGDITIDEARAQLSAIDERPPRYAASLTTFAFAVATGTAAAVFGGGAREMAIASALGALIDLVGRWTGRIPGAATIFQPVASFLAATVAWPPPGRRRQRRREDRPFGRALLDRVPLLRRALPAGAVSSLRRGRK